MSEISTLGGVRWRMIGLLAGALFFLAGLILWRIVPGWDAGIAASLRLAAGSPAAGFFRWLTMVGGAAIMIPVALAAATVLAVTGRFRALAWLVFTVASGRIAVEAMKYLVDRARPPLNAHLVDVATASFPSSHSAGTALTILSLLAIFRSHHIFRVVGFMLIIAIGFSRIMLGVHWPSDVLAGWGFGIFWVAACSSEKILPRGAVSPVRPLRARD